MRRLSVLRRKVQDEVDLAAVFGSGKVLCPWHEDRHPSLHIYDDHVHCFTCGAHADGVAYLVKRDGVSYRQALRHLWKYRGKRKRKKEFNFVDQLPAATAWHERLMAWEGAEGREYLENRGLLPSAIESSFLMLGWTGRGISIPHIGESKAWNVKVRPLERYRMDGEPKYMLQAKYHSPFLYPWDVYNKLFPNSKSLYLVEGEFDALILIQSGIPALATSGTGIQLTKWLWFLSKMEHIYLAFDQDTAGDAAVRRVMKHTDALGRTFPDLVEGEVTREKWRTSWGMDVTDAREKLIPHLLRKERISQLSLS